MRACQHRSYSWAHTLCHTRRPFRPTQPLRPRRSSCTAAAASPSTSAPTRPGLASYGRGVGDSSRLPEAWLVRAVNEAARGAQQRLPFLQLVHARPLRLRKAELPRGMPARLQVRVSCDAIAPCRALAAVATQCCRCCMGLGQLFLGQCSKLTGLVGCCAHVPAVQAARLMMIASSFQLCCAFFLCAGMAVCGSRAA